MSLYIKEQLILYAKEKKIDTDLPFFQEIDTIVQSEWAARFFLKKNGQFSGRKDVLALILCWKRTITPGEEVKYLQSTQTARIYQNLRDFGFILPYKPSGKQYERRVVGFGQKNIAIKCTSCLEDLICYITGIKGPKVQRDHIVPAEAERVLGNPVPSVDEEGISVNIFNSINYKKREECKKCLRQDPVTTPQLILDVQYIVDTLLKVISFQSYIINHIPDHIIQQSIDNRENIPIWKFVVGNNVQDCEKRMCPWNYPFKFLADRFRALGKLTIDKFEKELNSYPGFVIKGENGENS